MVFNLRVFAEESVGCAVRTINHPFMVFISVRTAHPTDFCASTHIGEGTRCED